MFRNWDFLGLLVCCSRHPIEMICEETKVVLQFLCVLGPKWACLPGLQAKSREIPWKLSLLKSFHTTASGEEPTESTAVYEMLTCDVDTDRETDRLADTHIWWWVERGANLLLHVWLCRKRNNSASVSECLYQEVSPLQCFCSHGLGPAAAAAAAAASIQTHSGHCCPVLLRLHLDLSVQLTALLSALLGATATCTHNFSSYWKTADLQARIAALGAAMWACISAVFQQLKHKNSSGSGEKKCGHPWFRYWM